MFVQEVLGVKVDPWQELVLRAFGRGQRSISIRACHGPGKTALAAWLVLYMLLCRFPQKTVATAPSAAQLKGALVPEVKMWFGHLPQTLQGLFEVKAEGIYLKAAPDSSFFEARTARAEAPEALQGVHSAHVLIIADEASGVPEPIFVAGVGAMSDENACTLLLSNPTRTSGYFYDSHHKNAHRWLTVHVSHKDSSRVSDKFVEEVADTWGRDSDEFRVRALGDFPRQDLNTLIPAEFVDSARKRDVVTPPGLSEVWGLDVARFGDDSNALVRRNKLAVLPNIAVWSGIDLMQTAGRVKAAWDETTPHLRPDEILIDEIGLGAGVVDRLRELNLPVRGINVSEASAMSDKYRNLRTELWFKCRDWLGSKNHKLPREECCERGGSNQCAHNQLADELRAPRYGYTSTGKLLVETKADMKRRGLASPNVADALMLTLASEPASLFGGSSSSTKSIAWNEPVRRGLSHV